MLLGLRLSGTTSLADGIPITTEHVVGSLVQPVFVTTPLQDKVNLFIVEQRGTIRKFDRTTQITTMFLDIRTRVVGSLENGLLGMAFHPAYSQNGFFFVYYIRRAIPNEIVVSRFTVPPSSDVPDPLSEHILLVIPNALARHVAGWIGFGPDEYLYVSIGDSVGNPQDLGAGFGGKILRLNVDQGDDFPADSQRNYAIPPDNPFANEIAGQEVWAYGLRNPWRCSFDRLTGDLYIADVGSSDREEINMQPSGTPGGRNYGWPCVEGTLCRNQPNCDCNNPNFTPPTFELPRDQARAIIGGYVYRGRCAIPEWQGRYLFSDFSDGKLKSILIDEEGADCLRIHDLLNSVSSLGEDSDGEIYLTLHSGSLRRIIPHPGCSDCDMNSVSDACQIADGTSEDNDENGIPDECVPTVQIIGSDPPDGAVDARQRTTPDGLSSECDRVQLTLSDSHVGTTPTSFCVRQSGKCEIPPKISNILPTGEDPIFTVQLECNTDICVWRTFSHRQAAETIRIGILPGDVTANGTADSDDVLALLDSLKGLSPRDLWSIDIDRSGKATVSDAIRLIDVLNRIGAFGQSPPCTLPPP